MGKLYCTSIFLQQYNFLGSLVNCNLNTNLRLSTFSNVICYLSYHHMPGLTFLSMVLTDIHMAWGHTHLEKVASTFACMSHIPKCKFFCTYRKVNFKNSVIDLWINIASAMQLNQSLGIKVFNKNYFRNIDFCQHDY